MTMHVHFDSVCAPRTLVVKVAKCGEQGALCVKMGPKWLFFYGSTVLLGVAFMTH